MSAQSSYEKYPPSTFANITFNKAQYCQVWTFNVHIDFTDLEKSTIRFSDQWGGVKQNFWKMAGTLECRVKSSDILHTVSFCCDRNTPKFEFEASKLHPCEKLDGTVKVNFTEIIGFSVRPRPWDFFHSGPETDVCLIAGGKRYYQNKKILAYHSPYFKSLFFGDFAEKNKDEVEIVDVKADAFGYLLDAMHGSLMMTIGGQEKDTFKYADRFDVPIATERAEQCLLIDTKMNKYQKLLLAEQFRLARVQSKVFSEWTVADTDEVLKGEEPHVRQFSQETLAIITQLKWKPETKN